MSGIDREPQLYWRVTAGDPETRMAIEGARQVTTQAGVSVQCECPSCAAKRDEQIANAQVVTSGARDGAWDYRYRGVVTQMDADIARAAMVNGIVKATVDAMTDEEAVLSPDSISKIWGTVFGEPVDEPIAPPPINWLTNMKPDTDTVEQRAAFLKKEGLACPTEITPDDVEAIGRVR